MSARPSQWKARVPSASTSSTTYAVASAGRPTQPADQDHRRCGQAEGEHRQRREDHREAGDPAVDPARRRDADGGQRAGGEQPARRGAVTKAGSRRAAPRHAAPRSPERSTGSAATAPEPSPRRIPRSRSGSRPRDFRAWAWAGSVERWPASHQAPHRARGPRPRQRAGDRHEAVEQDRHPAGGGLDQEPDGGGEVGAAQGGEQLDRVGGAALGAGEGLRDDVALAGPAVVVDAGAATGHLVGRQAEGRGDERGGEGGVADAEVAGHQQLGAVVDELRGPARRRRRSTARPPRGSARPSRWMAPEPRRTLRAVTSAGRSSRSASTATSSTLTATPCSRASARDARAARDEGAHHGLGDRSRVGRHPVRGDAVVAGEHHEAYVGRAGAAAPRPGPPRARRRARRPGRALPAGWRDRRGARGRGQRSRGRAGRCGAVVLAVQPVTAASLRLPVLPA